MYKRLPAPFDTKCVDGLAQDVRDRDFNAMKHNLSYTQWGCRQSCYQKSVIQGKMIIYSNTSKQVHSSLGTSRVVNSSV